MPNSKKGKCKGSQRSWTKEEIEKLCRPNKELCSISGKVSSQKVAEQ